MVKDMVDRQYSPIYLYYDLNGHPLPHCVDLVLSFVKGSISPEFGRQGMNIALMGSAIFGYLEAADEAGHGGSTME